MSRTIDAKPDMIAERRGRMLGRVADIAFPVGTILIIIALWELVCSVFAVPTYLLPPPTDVFALMVQRADLLLYHATVTSIEIVVGFALSIAIGITLALLITNYRFFERAIYPLLIVSQAVPKAALAPIFIVWFGLGWEPKVIVVILIAFFPIVIDLVAGIRSVPQSMHKLARSMGASRFDTMRKFVVPHALPHFFSGLKVAITLAVSGAIIGEFVGADRGLGYLLLFANGQLDTNLMFASIIILSFLGVTLFYLLLAVERLCMPWRSAIQTTSS